MNQGFQTNEQTVNLLGAMRVSERCDDLHLSSQIRHMTEQFNGIVLRLDHAHLFLQVSERALEGINFG